MSTIHRALPFALAMLISGHTAFAADWADPAKVLKVAFPIDVSGLDPGATQETYANAIEHRIFDALCVGLPRAALQIRAERRDRHAGDLG